MRSRAVGIFTTCPEREGTFISKNLGIQGMHGKIMSNMMGSLLIVHATCGINVGKP
jgi:hypothetical protein